MILCKKCNKENQPKLKFIIQHGKQNKSWQKKPKKLRENYKLKIMKMMMKAKSSKSFQRQKKKKTNYFVKKCMNKKICNLTVSKLKNNFDIFCLLLI